MPKYVIERTLPGAGTLSADQRREIARTSCRVISELGPRVQWLHSYFADDRIYCIYIAADEALLRQHAERGGFPIDAVRRVGAVVDPACSE